LNSGEKIYPARIGRILYQARSCQRDVRLYSLRNAWCCQEKSKVLWAIIQPNLDNFREFGEVNLRFVLKERFDNASQSLPFYKRLKGFTVTLDDLPLTTFR
jgi:hypothetical protein